MEPDQVGPEFVRIFEAHVDAIRAYCLRRLPPDSVDDALSDVFVVAWRRRADAPTGAALRPWLFGVARNVVRTAQRGRRRVSRLSSRLSHVATVPSHSDPESSAVERSSRSDVRLALSGLRDDDREILMLRAWEDLTVPEIAFVLGISLSAAEKRLTRALARLRPLLDEESPE